MSILRISNNNFSNLKFDSMGNIPAAQLEKMANVEEVKPFDLTGVRSAGKFVFAPPASPSVVKAVEEFRSKANKTVPIYVPKNPEKNLVTPRRLSGDEKIREIQNFIENANKIVPKFNQNKFPPCPAWISEHA